MSARISRNAWSCHPFYPKAPFAPIKLQRNMVFFPKPNTKYNTWGESRIVITISVCVSVHLFIHLHRYICTRMWIPQCRANVSHNTLHHICWDRVSHWTQTLSLCLNGLARKSQILLDLHPQCQDYSYTPPHPTCYMSTGDTNSGSQICMPTLYQLYHLPRHKYS